MPFEKLSRVELPRRTRPSGRKIPSSYIEFVGELRSGEGGRVTVAEEGVIRQQVKNRLKRAAKMTGRSIRFVRSGEDVVVFEVTSVARGRRPKVAA